MGRYKKKLKQQHRPQETELPPTAEPVTNQDDLEQPQKPQTSVSPSTASLKAILKLKAIFNSSLHKWQTVRARLDRDSALMKPAMNALQAHGDKAQEVTDELVQAVNGFQVVTFALHNAFLAQHTDVEGLLVAGTETLQAKEQIDQEKRIARTMAAPNEASSEPSDMATWYRAILDNVEEQDEDGGGIQETLAGVGTPAQKQLEILEKIITAYLCETIYLLEAFLEELPASMTLERLGHHGTDSLDFVTNPPDSGRGESSAGYSNHFEDQIGSLLEKVRLAATTLLYASWNVGCEMLEYTTGERTLQWKKFEQMTKELNHVLSSQGDLEALFGLRPGDQHESVVEQRSPAQIRDTVPTKPVKSFGSLSALTPVQPTQDPMLAVKVIITRTGSPEADVVCHFDPILMKTAKAGSFKRLVKDINSSCRHVVNVASLDIDDCQFQLFDIDAPVIETKKRCHGPESPLGWSNWHSVVRSRGGCQNITLRFYIKHDKQNVDQQPGKKRDRNDGDDDRDEDYAPKRRSKKRKLSEKKKLDKNGEATRAETGSASATLFRADEWTRKAEDELAKVQSDQ